MLQQHCKLISLCFVFTLQLSWARAQREYIVNVDPATGAITKIDSIPGIIWLVSYSTYNQTTKEYTVMGTHQLGQGPVYLYTLNALTGSIKYKPLLTAPGNYISFQYSRTTGILYAMIRENGVCHLATVNKTTGAYSFLNTITGIDGVGNFIIDEANQRLFICAVDGNPSFGLWTIDLATGNIIYHVSTKGISDLQYDNVTHKIYALTNRPGPLPGSSIISTCTVDPVTGIVTVIADIPGMTGIFSGHGTFNENAHLYLFAGIEQAPPAFLYSVDITTGNVISKAEISTSGVAEKDNLIFFRFDNTSNKLYALLWEAKTVAPVPVDSSCTLDVQTKVYQNPSTHTLIINKKITACKVAMNIYNTIGQLVLKDKIINDGLNEIPLSKFPVGIYYYEFVSNNKVLLSGKILNR